MIEVSYHPTNNETYAAVRIENQTLYMAFQEEGAVNGTIYINVYMTLYNKRKHTDTNEHLIKTTGLHPLRTVVYARKMFDALEQDAINYYAGTNDIVIYCTWLDNRRRDAYYKILSKKGYRYGKTLENKKCIYKKFKKEGCC